MAYIKIYENKRIISDFIIYFYRRKSPMALFREIQRKYTKNKPNKYIHLMGE